MKYDIKILPLTKSNLENFDYQNNGMNENFIDLGFKKNFNMYIDNLYKNLRMFDYINSKTENFSGSNVGGFRMGYTVDWLNNDPRPTSANPNNRFETTSETARNALGAISTAASVMGNIPVINSLVYGRALILGNAFVNSLLADSLNERSGTYTIDNYRTQRGITTLKDPYIDGPDFRFIYAMLKMRMGSILMGPDGYRKYILHMNSLQPDGEPLDPDAVIDDDAIERAMKTTLNSMTNILGQPNKQYEGVVQVNLGAAAIQGVMDLAFPILSLFLSTPRFEFTIENPTTGEKHTWSQGTLIGTSPPWGRDCEDGWDWGGCKCNTVSTDDIDTHMSIWDTYNTNDCDYFGRDKFNPHFSSKYPEGRYYCDNSIHQIRAYCPNDDTPRSVFGGTVEQKLFCNDTTPKIDQMIGEQKGNYNWCPTRPNAVKHQSCKEDECKHELVREGAGKLNINYGNLGFSSHPDYINKNFPVPPIMHYSGGAYHPGMGDTYINECGGATEVRQRTELGNHLFYKFNSNNVDTIPRCGSINDKKCNPCHGVNQNDCGNDVKYRMCEWTGNPLKCRPKGDYQVNFSGTGVAGGSYFDASFKTDKSVYEYDRGDGTQSKHNRYNQYAKYIDCRRHGLEDFQCFNPHIMSHLEKWCDALGIEDGYESWNDDSFGYDYRYNINRIDMIPDAFTDYTIMDYNNLDDKGNPTRKHKANWIGLQKPRALGYSSYKIAPWEKPFGGLHGHTDAMPGGNYATSSLNTEQDRLLFLNRGYCPTRYYEDGSSRYASRELNNYDDPVAFGFGPYSPHSHKAAGSLETALTGNNLGVCTWLNYRSNEHSKVLSQWLSDHNTYHKIQPSFELVNKGIVGSSKCTMASVNDSINRLELCRRYGIGGSEMGQIYFTDPQFIISDQDRECNQFNGNETLCNGNSTCEYESGECESRVGNLIRANHGEHLFQQCNSNTIMDFENICQRLNIPLYTSGTTKFFNTYKCNTRDVIKRFKYCASKNVNLMEGEVCDERLIQAQAMNTINQALMMQISRDTFYGLVLNSVSQNRHQALRDLERSQEIEMELQMAQNQDLVAASRTMASIEQDTMNLINQTDRKQKFINDADEARKCVLWNIGNNEHEPLKNQDIIRDPFNLGYDITGNNSRINEINKKCNTYKEPFPKKIIYGFAGIILLILIFVFFKA